MKRRMFPLLVVVCLAMVWGMGNAQAFQLITRDMIEKEVVVETDLIKMADNFIIVFDASSSSNDMVPGRSVSKIKAAKTMLAERNAWLPDLGYQAGLYIYSGRRMTTKLLQEVYPMQAYDRDRFGAAIDKLPDKGEGVVNMDQGLYELDKIVSKLKGKTAIVMFTDGLVRPDIRSTVTPLQLAQQIAKDNNVSFYLISSATDKVDQDLVDAVSQVNASSRVIPLTAFMDNPLYLSGALFTVNTSAYVRLKPTEKVVGVKTENILFAFNNAAISSSYGAKLDLLGDFLKQTPDAFVVAAGYADSIGDEEYNLALSRRRVEAFGDYLVESYGIDPGRIVTLWFGELNPVADNSTGEGRQLNRRVEIAVGGLD